MRIESLNVWGGKIREVLSQYIKKRSSVIDVFFFQEADKNFPEMANVLLRNFNRFDGYKYVNEDDFFPQATFVRKELDVIHTGTVLENTPNMGLGLVTKIKKENRDITLVNVHGISRPGNKKDSEERLRQSQGIIDHLKNENGLVVVGGDFNLDKDTKSVDLFEEAGYRNLIKEFKIRTTRNRLVWEKFPNNPQYHSNFMFVRNVEVVDFQVTENEVSDHLPMILEIKDN